MSSILNDVRVALRQYTRQPGFAFAVVGTLALTVGATTAVFAVVNTVLVRALPFAFPERLVWVASVRPDNPEAPFTLAEFMDYRQQTRSLAGLAAYAYWSASLAGDETTERVTGVRMSANGFDVFGVKPSAGRLLNDSDDRADAPPVVVLSYRLWQRRYAGSADIIGTATRVNGESFTIVGVLPAQFPLPLPDVDLITALAPDRDPLRHERSAANFLRFFGRLGPGTDATMAQTELTAICRALSQQFPVEYARKESVRVVAFQEALVGNLRQSMLVLLAAVVVVLATALANLVSLALVRANGRHGEITMRIAIGASRRHVVQLLTVEALVLAVAGSVFGWLLAIQMAAVSVRWAPPSIPRLGEVSLDGTAALLVAVVTVVVTALLTGAPLAAVTRARAGDVLRAASRGSIGDRLSHRVRNVMVVAEIAAALTLVLATIVLIQSLFQLSGVYPGFNPDGVFQARITLPSSYRSPDDLSRFYERVLERLSATPGVQRIGVISIAPLSGLLATVPFAVEGQPTQAHDRSSVNMRAISPGYLPVVGTRLIIGRHVSETDRSNTTPVALVSAALNDRFLGGRAVGQRLLIDDNNVGPRPVEIIGVVENVRQMALDQPASLDLYIPLRQIHADWVSLIRNNQFWMLRAGGMDPVSLRTTFLAHLRAIDPDAAVSSTGSMRQYLDAWLGPRRFNLGLFATFALTAVLLAVSGLYGLVSYAVSQRAGEIGLRMAIGASQRDVQRMILRQAGALAVAGALVGVCLAGAAWRLMASTIGDVSLNLLVIAATAALLIAVVLLAAWVPARRASRIEPTVALRSG